MGSLFKVTVLATGLAVLGLAGARVPAIAQASQDLGNNDAVFFDGKAFKVVEGKAKGDTSSLIIRLGAKELRPDAIIFRSGDKLYLVEDKATPHAPPQAMKDFQDNWNVSYMKDFQDNWNASYMDAAKNFQDNWNVSYMNAVKDFQDHWNVSYMKNFQDNWNISYVKTLKDFQDNWNTSYMK